MTDNTDNTEKEIEGEVGGGWWKGFFILLTFIAAVAVIISSIIYGMFYSSKNEDISPESESQSFFSSVLSYFDGDSADDEKLEENQSSDENESKKSTIEIKEIKKESDMYWSESTEKILQLEQKIETIADLVAKTFPAQIQQFEKEKKIMSVEVSEISFDESKNSEFTWIDVGKQLIELEKKREKIIAELSKNEK